MTTYYMHQDAHVFPQPEQFRPERWLNAAPDGLEHAYFLPFAKGSRSCAGQNVAYMNMYFTLSQLFKPGAPEIELFESTVEDVQLDCGYIFPQPKLDSNGLRVLIRSGDGAEE